MRGRGRAFTLLEVAASMAMAGVIAACALSAFAMLNRRLTVVQAATVANDRAKAAIEATVSRLQQVGGASVKPHFGLNVHNAPTDTADAFWAVPATPDDDRLLLAVTVPGKPECSVVSALPGALAPLPAPFGSVFVTATLEPTCCMQLGTFHNRQVMLTAGSARRQLYVDTVTVGGILYNPLAPGVAPGPGVSCVVGLRPGLLARDDTALGIAPIASYANGTMTVVDPAIYYLEPGAHRLIVLRDIDDDGEATVAERRVASAAAFALEAQLGYDCNGDGVLRDASGTDEWIFDGDDTLPAGCASSALRAVEVSLIFGAKVNDPYFKSSSTVPPGRSETRTGFQLRAGVGRAVLRNALSWGFGS